jgi:hypothetical protein
MKQPQERLRDLENIYGFLLLDVLYELMLVDILTTEECLNLIESLED